MSRSLSKGPFTHPKLLKKIGKLKQGDKTIIKTWSRDSVITPEMVGYTFGVHNGKIHISVLVVENMVGHKLGEFSPTRKFVRHGGKMQKEAEQAAADASRTASAAAKPEAKK
jgi:small subunit ribosomal protein S19